MGLAIGHGCGSPGVFSGCVSRAGGGRLCRRCRPSVPHLGLVNAEGVGRRRHASVRRVPTRLELCSEQAPVTPGRSRFCRGYGGESSPGGQEEGRWRHPSTRPV